jgi:iron complex outermembrane receptor protein
MFAMMMSGAEPLAFVNVDAKLHGLDLAYQWIISDSWLLRGNLSYVRGKRSDVTDNLYRIAPISSFMELRYAQDRYFLTAESVAATKQDKVADFNNEKISVGWGIVNLRGGLQLSDAFNMTLGVDNIFDRAYQDHLGGYNRVQDSDVPLGERLFSKGRNFSLKINANW